MFCTGCGNQLSEKDLFCTKCGAKVHNTPNKPRLAINLKNGLLAGGILLVLLLPLGALAAHQVAVHSTKPQPSQAVAGSQTTVNAEYPIVSGARPTSSPTPTNVIIVPHASTPAPYVPATPGALIIPPIAVVTPTPYQKPACSQATLDSYQKQIAQYQQMTDSQNATDEKERQSELDIATVQGNEQIASAKTTMALSGVDPRSSTGVSQAPLLAAEKAMQDSLDSINSRYDAKKQYYSANLQQEIGAVNGEIASYRLTCN